MVKSIHSYCSARKLKNTQKISTFYLSTLKLRCLLPIYRYIYIIYISTGVPDYPPHPLNPIHDRCHTSVVGHKNIHFEVCACRSSYIILYKHYYTPAHHHYTYTTRLPTLASVTRTIVGFAF